MKQKEIAPIIKITTRPSMSRMEAFNAFCKAEPLISLDWQSFKRVWPSVHPAPVLSHFLQCNKCDGVGTIRAFRHVQAGVCFDCKGRGKSKISAKEALLFSNHSDPRVRAMLSNS